MSDEVDHVPDDTPQFQAAYKKGALAAREGKSEQDCPYKDKRTKSGRLTFARAFRKRWLEGFRTEKSASSNRKGESQ